jgi:hypothetical protein
MSPKNLHLRLLLGKNASGSVVFCEECDVIELEIGAISLRLDAHSLEALSQLLKESAMRLSYYTQEKAQYVQQIPADCSFH